MISYPNWKALNYLVYVVLIIDPERMNLAERFKTFWCISCLLFAHWIETIHLLNVTEQKTSLEALENSLYGSSIWLHHCKMKLLHWNYSAAKLLQCVLFYIVDPISLKQNHLLCACMHAVLPGPLLLFNCTFNTDCITSFIFYLCT